MILFTLLVLGKYYEVLLEAVSQGTLPLKDCSTNTEMFPRLKSHQYLPNANFSSSFKHLLQSTIKEMTEFNQMRGTNSSHHPPDFQGPNKTTEHKHSKQSLARLSQMQTFSQNREERKKKIS